MLRLWPKRKSDPETLRERLFERFAGHGLIVHEGFPDQWLEELLKEPGGAGYFRVDARQAPRPDASPVEWLVHEHIRPLGLPMPLFVAVREGCLLLRHLHRGSRTVHPSEILWMLDEIDTRFHVRLEPAAGGFAIVRGLDIRDNDVESMFGVQDPTTK